MRYLARYSLKFPLFCPEAPIEAFYTPPPLDAFLRRVELGIADGGFAMLTGEPGTGKTIALRLLEDRLRRLPNVSVGAIEHPQSRTSDFYRELGDHFGVSLSIHNRWGGFKALRARWNDHIAQTLTRPVLILDEAQEAPSAVLNELRILASKDLDSKQLLCVVLAGDARLPERFRTPELLPLGSRIRRRFVFTPASNEELLACLDHQLQAAGNPTLMSPELKATLVEHCVGNYRILMSLAGELLTAAAERELSHLDEKLYFDVFGQPAKPKSPPRKR
jgi:type II secretory pathway predicted ATPase ExeA